jgi:hypothetical protein
LRRWPFLRGLSRSAENQQVKEEDDIDAATRRMQDMKAQSKGAPLRWPPAMSLTT